jgi:uncharacterized protein
VEPTALRASSYIIYVDLPGVSDEMLLVHGYSGAYDRVSRRVATYVRSLESGHAPKPLYGDWSPEIFPSGEAERPSDKTLEMLTRRGYLTGKTRQEEEALFGKMAARLHGESMQQMPGYIFMPTYQCNLRCPYCFQDHMRTNPAFSHLLRTVDTKVVDRIFTAMPQIEAGHGVTPGSSLPRSITFFGGEPLLEASRPIIEYILQKAQAMGPAAFSAISNATELHAYKDLLGPKGISFIQVTLDGPPQEHDRRRIYPDGSGSYHRIVDNIHMALAQGTRVSVRLNIDRNNVQMLPALVDEFHAQGWAKTKGFSAYAAPVNASNDKTAPESTLGSWELTKALQALREADPRASVINGPDDGIEDRVRQIFEKHHSPLPNFRASYCGAHNKMYIFDAFGDIYACWERTGDAKIRIGYVNEQGAPVMNKAITDMWRSRTVTSNPVCKKCRFAFYCGGGCAILAEGRSGTLHSNFCDGFGKRFRAAAAKAYVAYRAGDTPSENTERVCDM